MSLFSFGSRAVSKPSQVPRRKMVAFGMIRVQQPAKDAQDVRANFGQVNVLGMMIIEDRADLLEPSLTDDPSI